MPSIGILLCKDDSNDPPMTAASATPTSPDAPSTSKDPRATASDPESSDDGPPPSKSRRLTRLTINTARRHGMSLKADQVSMSRKRAQRSYNEESFTAEGNTGADRPSNKGAPFADLTNSPVVQTATSIRPKRAAAAKPLVVDLTDSDAEGESSSSSDFEIDAEQVSENDADVGELSDADAGDLDFHASSSTNGGTPVLHDETMNDSAQITVFGNPPPSISCKVIACPLLKLFHQLTDTERRKFTKKDAIAGACSFCGMKAGVRENTGGVSALAEHFFENGWRVECTRTGCAKVYANFNQLLGHYGIAHDNSSAQLKCSKCQYVATTARTLRSHEEYPHPKTRSEALTVRSVHAGIRPRREDTWQDPQYCDLCETYFAEWDWETHKRHHKEEVQTSEATTPMRVQITGLRDDKCPFEDCDDAYVDFIGWYLHCKEKHSDYVAKSYIPAMIDSDERERMPTFRCTTCQTRLLIGQVQRHRFMCIASVLPETVGPLMKQRALDYNDKPGLIRLQHGLSVFRERQLMGVLRAATVPGADSKWIENTLRAIRSDPFVRSFVKRNQRAAERNQRASERNVLYTVAKIRNGTVPRFCTWVTDLVKYAGSTSDVVARVGNHIESSISRWAAIGLELREDEELYLCRMSITIDDQTTVSSFTYADVRRLEQVVIDSLGMCTLYNTLQVLASATMLNDVTYRNHIAPRLNQLALVIFDSTYKRLSSVGFKPDNQNIWQLPVSRAEAANRIRQAPDVELGASMDSANDCLNTKSAISVDQACSPIPPVRIFSPDLREAFFRFKRQEGLSDEEVLSRLGAQRTSTRPGDESMQSAPTDHRPDFANMYSAWPQVKPPVDQDCNDFSDVPTTSYGPDLSALEDLRDNYDFRHRSERHKSHMSADKSEKSAFSAQRTTTSPDLFADFCPEMTSTRAPNDWDNANFANVRTTSNGLDHHAIEELRASPARADAPEPDKLLMLAGDSAHSGLPRRPSSDPSDRLLRSGVSATKTAPVSKPSVSVVAPVAGPHIGRIPRYGRRCTQYVDLEREPVDLTDDSSSEASLDEPLPTDSGIDMRLDYSIVLEASRKQSEHNAEKSDVGTAAKKTIRKVSVSDDNEDDEEADSYTIDKCASKNCRRPQYENVNWVQCDDCDEWYHNLCILSAEMPFEEGEFHCGCTKNGKRKPGQACHSK